MTPIESLTAQLKTDHPEQWENFEKYLSAFKAQHGPCNEVTALYFYSAGVQEIGKLIKEMGNLFAGLPL